MNTQLTEAPLAVDRDHAIDLLRQMVLIRRFEEKCVELYSGGAIRGFVHDSFGVKEADGLHAFQGGQCSVWVEQGPLASVAGVRFNHIPYKGGGQAYSDVAGGQLDRPGA